MCQSSSCFCYNFPFVLNLLFLGQKSSLVSGEWAGEIFFITYLPAEPNMYQKIYIYKYIYIYIFKTYTQTNKCKRKEKNKRNQRSCNTGPVNGVETPKLNFTENNSKLDKLAEHVCLLTKDFYYY